MNHQEPGKGTNRELHSAVVELDEDNYSQN